MLPDVILAYALYDSENTGRLGEHPEELPEYVKKARGIINALKEFRPMCERVVLAREIVG